MPTPTSRTDRRLSPWSPFTVGDLADGAPRVLEAWKAALEECGEEPRTDVLLDHVRWTLEGVGRWIGSDEPEVPDDLRSVFRDLAFAYRSQGCRLDETLRDLERLEDLLVGDGEDGEGGEGSANRALRRAMRALWTETIQLNDALAQRRGRERTDALETFGQILSHELGNRLGAARTGVDILRDAPARLSEERRDDLLDLVSDGIDEALRTVDDVSAFVQSHRWAEDTLQPFDEVVAGVLKGLGPEARGQGVELRVPADLPDAPVDAGRLRLILSNFLVNGIRYADPSEEEPWVRLRVERRDDTLHVSVADNGIGIPEEEQAEVFRFHRRGRHHEGREGSGLGLTIASEAVSQLGGEVRLESRVGEGTTFHATIPVGVTGGEVSGSASS